jgi:radical SAM C-methyltransferase
MEQTEKLLVQLVQQGVWNMPLESMPLAAGYLKAVVLNDQELANAYDVEIRNFRGETTAATMAKNLFGGGRVPDVLAFSVLGWNYRVFGILAETFKQLRPDGLVIFGGTHVANQGERVFRMFPQVDIVANGEGEFVFREILRARLAGGDGLERIQGISFQGADGVMVTTPAPDRITDLDLIPSPFLTGAIDMTDKQGRFRYDVALMETSRGCPYKCAFCYWGGAVGQKVRAFSRERLRAELEYFAKFQVHTIVLCDSNFGLLPQDLQFIEDVIEVRGRYGFPRAVETSWAKNKSKTFYEIVRRMSQAGLRSSFTLALQTLDDNTLDLMNRRNMKVNSWEDLAEWLAAEGLDCYAELIWGAPGETVASFMRGYDELSRRVARIAAYPMLLLPNTDYTEKRAQYGIISVRGDTDDFEYVLSTGTMTFAENEQMQRFLFWARVMAEMAVLRHVWVGLRELAGITQSQALTRLGSWVERTDDPAAEVPRNAMQSAIAGTGDLVSAVSFMFCEPAAKRLLRRWWAEDVRPGLSDEVAGVLDEIFQYDLLTQPVCAQDDGTREELPEVTVFGERYFLRRGARFRHDIPAVLDALRARREPDLESGPVTVDLYYRVGAESAVHSTNHETIVHFMGMPRQQAALHAGSSADA